MAFFYGKSQPEIFGFCILKQKRNFYIIVGQYFKTWNFFLKR